MTTTQLLRTPLGSTVKIIEVGAGEPVVFLHSAVGSAGEWKPAFAHWPSGHRLIAVEAYRGGSGPASAGARTLDHYVDQVVAVAEYVGAPLHLVGFSWGGATALRMATTAPHLLASVSVIEPEAYSLLPGEHPAAYARICAMRDRVRGLVGDGRWEEALAVFIDFYNGEGAFARWQPERRVRFVAEQRTRGDLWDVLFDAPLTPASLAGISLPVQVVEGTATSSVDHAICDVVARHVPGAVHTLIEGAGHMMPLTHAPQLTEALLRGPISSRSAMVER